MSDSGQNATVGRMWNPGIMSSVRSDWATPRTLFAMLDKEFHFYLDSCATEHTAVTKRWISRDMVPDGLDADWVKDSLGQTVWCNPGYGRQIGDWVEKAYRESMRGATVVMLLPSRTDCQWFHDYCLRGEIRFLRGRLSFDDQTRKGRAPFPSMLVIFRPKGKS